MRLGSTSSTITTRGIIKAKRICCCSQPATSYLSPSARYAPVNGLAGCSVSIIGKPHEYFDLTCRLELSGLGKRWSSFWRKSSNRKASGDSGGFEFFEFFLPYTGFFEFRDKAVFRALGFQP